MAQHPYARYIMGDTPENRAAYLRALFGFELTGGLPSNSMTSHYSFGELAARQCPRGSARGDTKLQTGFLIVLRLGSDHTRSGPLPGTASHPTALAARRSREPLGPVMRTDLPCSSSRNTSALVGHGPSPPKGGRATRSGSARGPRRGAILRLPRRSPVLYALNGKVGLSRAAQRGGILVVLLAAAHVYGAAALQTLPYVVVDTGQTRCYGNWGPIAPPLPGEPFYGQDAQFDGPQPAYKDNGDGTVSDLNTSLMWVKARGAKVTWREALAGASACRVGGYTDWRMPSIKELYSLINFDGGFHLTVADSRPYVDTRYFDFTYGDEAKGERPIDCQDWSATTYLGTTMGGNPTAFGVNFADGRIKGYPKSLAGRPDGGEHRLYVRYVRGNPDYGRNDFRDNGDGTITDRATGLMWSKADSGQGMDWQSALAWAQAGNTDKHLGHDDWRLPNAKELQSIVDYARAPSVTHSPALDPIFQTSVLSDGEYPWYWTSTTHLDGPPDRQGNAAVYIAFGTAWGYLWGRWLDVHGAGAQRSDPKSGDPAWFPYGRGPQGDQIRIRNYVRLVCAGLH